MDRITDQPIVAFVEGELDLRVSCCISKERENHQGALQFGLKRIDEVIE